MQSVRRLVFIAFFLFMVAKFWREPRLPYILLGVIAVVGAFFATFSLFNLYRLGELSFSYRESALFSSAIPGVADFGNTIVAAMHYAACYCAALWMLLVSRNRYLIMVWSITIATTGLYIIMTFSRTGWVASLIASLILLVLTLYRGEWRRIIPLVAVLVGLLLWFANKYLKYEFYERGLTHRDEIWNTVLLRMESSWLWGHGAGAKLAPIAINEKNMLVHNTHNIYLEVLYQFGLVGLSLVVVVLLMALKELFFSAFSKSNVGCQSYGLALLGAAAVIMFVELNSFASSPNLVWVWLWLPLGIALSILEKPYAES